MSRVFFFISEGLRALRRSAAPSVASIVTVAVTMLLLGVLIPVLQATERQDRARSATRSACASSSRSTPPSRTSPTLETAASGHPARRPGRVRLQGPGPGAAAQRLRGEERGRPDRAAARRAQPAARLLQRPARRPREPAGDPLRADSPGRQRRARADQPGDPRGHRLARGGRHDHQGHRRAQVGPALISPCLLPVASLLLVGNTIRLSIYARRREVEVMQLVGATNWFIRWPFVVEGLVCGLIGGAGRRRDPLPRQGDRARSARRHLRHRHGEQTISFAKLIVVLLAVAMAVSAIGSGLTLRRFLRV